MKHQLAAAFVPLLLGLAAHSQTDTTVIAPQTAIIAQHIVASAAYAEVLLRKTELNAELQSLAAEYTEDYPKVKEVRFTLEVLGRESDRLTKIKPSEAGRLTMALGKLVVRKSELEVDLWKLRQSYSDIHPDVKRAKRRVDVYESAISELLR